MTMLLIFRHMFVIVSGRTTRAGVKVTTERPVFGGELLEQLYQKICRDGENLALQDIYMIATDEICLASKKATILYVSEPFTKIQVTIAF